MSSWAVTGATRGIGFGFVDKLSADPTNQVFALIRSRKTAGPLEELASKRKNIHILLTHISDPEKLDATAAEIAEHTGGSLDVLILNAASAGPETNVLPPSAFRGKIDALNNEINANIHAILTSNIYVILAFLDLVRNGAQKKIIHTSSNSGDVEFNRITGMASVLGYGAAKAAMNLAISKFAADLAPEGIKFLSLAPGWVATDAAEEVTGDPEVRKWILNAFHKIDPSVTGPVPVEESVASQLGVIGRLSAANSGKFVGRFGDSNWF